MEVKVDGRYRTRAGKIVVCLKDEGGGIFTCQYESNDKCDQWTSRGFWAKMPGGMHDIVEDLSCATSDGDSTTPTGLVASVAGRIRGRSGTRGHGRSSSRGKGSGGRRSK